MKRYDIINTDKNTSVKDIYDLFEIHFRYEAKKYKKEQTFWIDILDIMHYYDYQGCYAVYEEGNFIKYDINNCDKKSPFWKALWKLEKDLSKKYKLNFNDIRFSFWYRGPIHFTKIKQ